LDAIRPCIACNQGCLDHVFLGTPIECVLNPQAGHEADRLIEPASAPKKVVVVGAGPAGTEAARVAAARGHRVVLIERQPIIGGALWYAGSPPGRQDFARYIEYLEAELDAAGVDVVLGVEATVDKIRDERPDVVIVAAGATPVVPPLIRDATHPNVVLAEDVLGGKAVLRGDVVVVGGGSVGVETALSIAQRDALSPETAAFLLANDAETPERVKELLTTTRRRIYVCDLLPRLAGDMGRSTRWTVLKALKRFGAELLANARVTRIDATGVTVQSENGASRTLPCGTVVAAVGYRPRQELAQSLTAAGFNVQVIGDAKAPRLVSDAVHEGFLTALRV
jgi:2,4-dienoyl-CoA reductase (NADPH2)